MFKVYLERMNKYEINHVSHFHWKIKLLFVFKVSLEFDPECYNYLVFISEFQYISIHNFTWVKAFKNGPSKICWRHALKYLKWYDLLKQIISLQFFWRLSSTNVTWSILEYFDIFWAQKILPICFGIYGFVIMAGWPS